MYYLKYRPKKLIDLDNTRAKDTIIKVLNSPNIPHALLFVGDKGTGKTSTARLFAKSINCLNNKYSKKGQSVEPCNECKNCKSIDATTSVDIVEMDAASNRGIEEIRKIIQETAFAPMSNKYRVFIIDEAHMITNDAFNALLKTLEEPPKSVIFILATTNIEKVPKTIISRCSVINFYQAQKQDIINMLKRIAVNENLKLDNKLLTLIARHSDNSFRDAAKVLEELVVQEKTNPEEASEFLGMIGKETLLEVMQSKDLKKTLVWIEEFKSAGGSFKKLIEQSLEDLRIQLLIKNSVVTDIDAIKLKYNMKEISTLIKLFTQAYGELKISPIESIPVEMAVVDFYNTKSKN
ncbi:MAG: DNA polymerase III subunit gamma/tau [Patescibacteria group bacterium]